MVLIDDVLPGSAADEAGVKRGDYLIRIKTQILTDRKTLFHLSFAIRRLTDILKK